MKNNSNLNSQETYISTKSVMVVLHIGHLLFVFLILSKHYLQITKCLQGFNIIDFGLSIQTMHLKLSSIF